VGYRGNQGFSNYKAIENRISVNNLFHSGIVLTASHTWSHAVDNMSSTFFESGGSGIANRYGDRNITTNNGSFVTGLLDPYKPALDEGDADFDVRHRIVVSGVWSVPAWKKRSHLGFLLEGWKFAPIFTARTGQPFSVFDTTAQTLDYSAPRATFTQQVATKRNTFRAAPTPNTFHLFTFLPAQITHQPNNLTPTSQWPANMTQRNSFRAPGLWNADAAIYKDTRLTESLTLQLRAEFFNVFNHPNLYVIGTSANVGTGNTVEGCFGCSGSSYDRRQVQLAARVSF
jgi:hypothetical protein